MPVEGHVGRDADAVTAPPVAPVPPRTLRGAVAGSLVGKAVEMATLVLLATVVPRLLGPVDYGHFAVPLTVVTVGSLALTLGGPALMARFVPAATPPERVALARALGLRLARGRALQLLGIAVVAAGASAWQPHRFPPATTAVVVTALALNVVASLALQAVLGLGRTGAWSTRFPLQNAVLIAVVLVLHPIAGEDGAVLAILISASAGAAFALVAARPVLGPQPPVAVPPGAIRFGVLQASGAALTQVTQRGGVLAVALLAGSTVQTGYASLAIGIALGATYAILQAFTVSLPHLAERAEAAGTTPVEPGGGEGAPGRPATAGAEAVLRRLAGDLVAVLVPGALAGAGALGVLVPRVFGWEFENAVGAFGPALAIVVLAPLHSLVVQVSALRLRPEVALAAGATSFAAFVAVSAAAIPTWGATGGTAAALAGTAAGIVTALVLLPGAAGRLIPAVSGVGAGAVLLLAWAT